MEIVHSIVESGVGYAEIGMMEDFSGDVWFGNESFKLNFSFSKDVLLEEKGSEFWNGSNSKGSRGFRVEVEGGRCDGGWLFVESKISFGLTTGTNSLCHGFLYSKEGGS